MVPNGIIIKTNSSNKIVIIGASVIWCETTYLEYKSTEVENKKKYDNLI